MAREKKPSVLVIMSIVFIAGQSAYRTGIAKVGIHAASSGVDKELA